MTTQTASTASAKFIDWNKAIQIKNGFLPADLSIALGSAKLQNIWLNIRKRTITEIANEVKALWIEAVAVENNIDQTVATERVNDFISRYDSPANWVAIAVNGSWSMPCEQAIAAVKVESVEATTEALTEEEIKSAKKVAKLIKADKLNETIFWYIVQNYPIHSVGFCKTAGVDTRTMQARARAIQSAITGSLKNETVATHLTRIMGIKPKTAGGQLKTR